MLGENESAATGAIQNPSSDGAQQTQERRTQPSKSEKKEKAKTNYQDM